MSEAQPIGINLAFVNDYSLGDYWINRAKQLRVQNGGDLQPLDQEAPYGAYDNGGTIAYTSDLYPASLSAGQAAGYILQAGTDLALEAGSWVVRWDGTDDIYLTGGTLPTQLLSGSGASNRHVVTFTGSTGTSIVSLQGTDIANLEILRLADEVAYDAGQKFRTAFLDQLDDFDFVRFLNFQGVNDYAGFTDWVDRPQASNLAFTGPGGVPAEEMIALCNAASKDAYIHIPHTWTNQTIRSFADLLATTLTGKVYCELSNETWNALFSQATWLYDTGERLGYGSDRFSSGRRFLAQRSREVFRIFSEAFTTAGRDLTDLVKMLCWQNAQGADHFPDLLEWRQTNLAINHYATAPYPGGKLGDNTNYSATLALSEAAVVAAVQEEWDNYLTTGGSTRNAESLFDIFAGLAPLGLQAATYEAGQHLLDETSPTQSGVEAHLRAAAAHGDMASLYQSIVTDWFGAGGGPLTILALNWFPSTSGYWGLYTSDMEETPGPKLTGLRAGIAAAA